MRENLAIAKLYKLGIKSLAEVDLLRQVGPVYKAIIIPLCLCGAGLSECQYFGSPGACFATYLLCLAGALHLLHGFTFLLQSFRSFLLSPC